MALTKSDEALVEIIAFRVGEIIAARLSADRARDLERHSLTCPTMATVRGLKILAVGMGIGGMVVGGAGTLSVMNLLKLL